MATDFVMTPEEEEEFRKELEGISVDTSEDESEFAYIPPPEDISSDEEDASEIVNPSIENLKAVFM